MTTIAYRAGIMAADSGSWMGDACHEWARKLARGPDGTLYGVSGSAAACKGFLDWVRGGCDGDYPKPQRRGESDNTFIVLVAPPEGALRLIAADGEEEFYQAKYFAIGAGAQAAFGALWAGSSAADAIEAAKAHASGAFGPVQSIRHQDGD